MTDQLAHVDPPEGALRGLICVFLNGPKRSGKDSAAKAIVRASNNAENMKFSRRLKESVHADFGRPDLPHDYFEDVKDEPLAFFMGKTPRQAYIIKSERMVKVHYGPRFYGQIFLRDLWAAKQAGVQAVGISDSGFTEEALPVIRAVGPEYCLLLRIHAEDRGCKFDETDSRGYIRLPGVETKNLTNNGTVEEWDEKVLSAVRAFSLTVPR